MMRLLVDIDFWEAAPIAAGDRAAVEALQFLPVGGVRGRQVFRGGTVEIVAGDGTAHLLQRLVLALLARILARADQRRQVIDLRHVIRIDQGRALGDIDIFQEQLVSIVEAGILRRGHAGAGGEEDRDCHRGEKREGLHCVLPPVIIDCLASSRRGAESDFSRSYTATR